MTKETEKEMLRELAKAKEQDAKAAMCATLANVHRAAAKRLKAFHVSKEAYALTAPAWEEACRLYQLARAEYKKRIVQ